jgi:predicted nucleotidyltransferase component of viral defense system
VPFRVESRWFAGEAAVTTYEPNELLATKLRALYQRKKGRDLFDLWLALERGFVEPSELLRCFHRYMAEGPRTISRAQFEANLHEKRNLPAFRSDVEPLVRPGMRWNFEEAMDAVLLRIVSLLPGDPWQGSVQ